MVLDNTLHYNDGKMYKFYIQINLLIRGLQ